MSRVPRGTGRPGQRAAKRRPAHRHRRQLVTVEVTRLRALSQEVDSIREAVAALPARSGEQGAVLHHWPGQEPLDPEQRAREAIAGATIIETARAAARPLVQARVPGLRNAGGMGLPVPAGQLDHLTDREASRILGRLAAELSLAVHLSGGAS